MTTILVYGAGPLGSLFAARLQRGGNDVSILSRGQCLAELREHGIVLIDVQTQTQTVTRVEVQHLIGEFMALAHTTSVPMPTIVRLLQYYQPDAPLVPDGSAEIPLRWGGLLVALGALATFAAGAVLPTKQLASTVRR